MRVSFSGTRAGMSGHQKSLFGDFLRSHRNRIALFSHGCCAGSDIEAHAMAREICGPSLFVAIFPSTARTRAPIPADADFVADPKPPRTRDRDIVDVGHDLLVAAPLQDAEVVRSGTWTTVRYARKMGVRVMLLEREAK